MTVVGLIVGFVIWLYLLVLTVRAVISLVPLFIRDWTPRGPMLVIAEVVYTVTDPPLKFLRRFVPPLRLGGMRLDVAFIVLYVVLTIVQRLVYALV